MVKTELMIGDWYKWYVDGKYYYYQVVSPTFQLDDSTIGNFEPISLTTDLLLANGFKVKDNKYTLQKFYGDGGISITVIDEEDGLFSISMYSQGRFNDEERRIVVEKEFVTVHQFQHWLRDCDINFNFEISGNGTD